MWENAEFCLNFLTHGKGSSNCIVIIQLTLFSDLLLMLVPFTGPFFFTDYRLLTKSLFYFQASGFRNVHDSDFYDSDGTRMFCVRGTGPDDIRAFQVGRCRFPELATPYFILFFGCFQAEKHFLSLTISRCN
jgi:hypothetical protein